MCKTIKNASVEILLDLDIYHEEHGSYKEREPNVKEVRPLIETLRTAALRDIIGKRLFDGLKCDRPDTILDLNNPETYSDNVEYVLNYLNSGKFLDSRPDTKDFYYMSLTKSNASSNSYYLEIILKEGFIAKMKEDLSHNFKMLLQDILRLLDENGITDSVIVGYYMNLALKSNDSFIKNFNSFFLGEQ